MKQRLFLTLGLIAPFAICFVALQYIVNYDESYQLQAAVQLHKGFGYRALWWQLQHPYFTQGDYLFLKQWPIGYSAFVAGLMLFHFNVIAAAKLINIVFLFVGIVGWDYYHIKRLGAGQITKNIVLVYLVISGMQILSNPTNLMVWSLFPFLLLLLSEATQATAKRYWYAFMAGFVIGVCMTLRYQAFAFIGIPVIFFMFCTSFSFFSKLRLLTFSLLLPVLTALAIWYSNHLHSSVSTFAVPKSFSFDFNPVWFSDGMINLLTDPFSFTGFAPSIFIQHQLGGLLSYKPVSLFFTVFGLAGILLGTFYVKRQTRERKINVAWNLFLTSFLCIYLFLSILSVFFYARNYLWAPIMEGRYFSFLFPFLVILALQILTRLFSPYRKNVMFVQQKISVSLLLTGFFLCLFFTAQYTRQAKANMLLQGEVNQTLSSYHIRSNSSILFVQEGLQTFFHPFDEYAVYPVNNDTYEIFFSGNRYFDKPTTLVLISIKSQPFAFTRSIRGKQTFDDLAATLNMHKYTGNLITVYIKSVKSGEVL